jgi:dephospho-CoA kinase
MKIIGLTGGIGSGKSTIARVFQVLGIPVYDADSRAKALMVQDPELVKGIRAVFGADAYVDGGALNRGYIAAQAFSDPDKLAQLNALVHPVTIADAERWAHQQKAPYVLKEAALMFESASFHQVDAVIQVYAPATVRLHRVMKRDGQTREAVLARMKNQLSDSIVMKLADYVIYNDAQQMVIPQVLQLDATIRQTL